MRPKSFDYLRPRTINETVSLLAKHGEYAKILAGGQSLVPLMKLRLVEPRYLIDIADLQDLRYIRKKENVLLVGALTTHHDLEVSGLTQEHCPSLWDAAFVLGDPLIRNRGTIGGAISHHDPAADYPAVLVSLNARFTVAAPNGSRYVPAEDFFVDFFTTQMSPDELLCEIEIPILQQNEGAAYLKMERVVGDFAIVGAAARVKLDTNGAAEEVRIALSAVDKKPVIPNRMINKLVGKKLEETIVREAAEEIRGLIKPVTDIRASSEYRVEMAVVYARRAVLDAARRARRLQPIFVAQNQPLRAN